MDDYNGHHDNSDNSDNNNDIDDDNNNDDDDNDDDDDDDDDEHIYHLALSLMGDISSSSAMKAPSLSRLSRLLSNFQAM